MSIKTITPELVYANFHRNNIPIDTRFHYEILGPKYLNEVARVFTEAFCRSEPMTEYLHLDEMKYMIFARAVTEQAIKDQLSIVALDKKNGAVVAFALVEDMARPGALPDFDPRFNTILALLESLGSHYFQNKKLEPNSIAHLFITAVNKDYRHQGLSTQVNFRAMDLAAQKGFEFVYCELTNYFNEKGIIPHLHNEKQLIGSQVYKNFKIEGEAPFAHLEGGANSYLWEINKK